MMSVIPAQAGIQFQRWNLGPGSVTKMSRGDELGLIPGKQHD